MVEGDLVVVSLPGVQRWIAESGSTSEVRASSEIAALLAQCAAAACSSAGGVEVVFPSRLAGAVGVSEAGVGDGVPNRVVALAPAGTGEAVARAAVEQVRVRWRGFVRSTFGLPDDRVVPGTPGMPLVQWVCVPAAEGTGGYREQWGLARELLVARRRVRDFEDPCDEGWRDSQLCSLSPRWPAGPVPARARSFERKRPLSTVNRVKQLWRRTQGREGFPSTASVASAGFRREVLREDSWGEQEVRELVRWLRQAAEQVARSYPETPVPGVEFGAGDTTARWFATCGGPWVYPDHWQLESLVREYEIADPESVRGAVESGRWAARRLTELMEKLRGVPEPASYLAVMVQDLDSMGRYLSGTATESVRLEEVSAEAHAGVSRALQGLAGRQRAALVRPELMGVPVYAGGDDLLALLPAVSALRAAERCNALVPEGLPRASTAVLFFHYHFSLQRALTRARELLEEAKASVSGKHALAMGFLRRSGESGYSIQPWKARGDASSAVLFDVFAADRAHRLSPRLVTDLVRDAGELNDLAARAGLRVYRAELARLVGRHVEAGPPESADARAEAVARAAGDLGWLGANERYGAHLAARRGDAVVDGRRRPEHAARVGVFLRQEAR